MANQLQPGLELLANQKITANNGRAFLIMQGDGNFVLYEVHRGKNISVWASGTNGRGGVKAIMRDNGSLVICNANGQTVWDSGTAGNPGAYLILQDDGNAVIYTKQGKALWDSGTWRHSRKLGFDPAVHGFLFSNSFVNAVAKIPGYGQVTTYGRCGGMTFAALDYFLKGIPVPKYTRNLFNANVPPDGHWLADYIYSRLMDSFLVVSSINYVRWTLASDHSTVLGGKGVTRWTKEDEFPKLRAIIDAGKPVALGLIGATSLEEIGSKNHQVLAYGYEWHPKAEIMKVFVYDNNTISQEVVLSSEPGNPHFDATNTSPWRGFFVVDYQQKNPPVFTSKPPAANAAVRYGQTIKVSHLMTGLTLHSHALNYGHKGSSGQQQVTCFKGADDNDFWKIKGANGTPANHRINEVVQHGDVIRLEHMPTQRNLHSHRGHPSPVTGQQEVTGFGTGGQGDDNDNWRVEIDGGGQWTAQRRVRLVHLLTNHTLHSHRGFSDARWTAGQQEVTGFGNRDDNDWWWLLEIR
ncbi:MIR domain-containing protein [Bacillus sp. FJAT-29814]|uniref:MIR domain-containing protein n=1 Tax=Bacillus sp. FJAT-29814 TaxID=1729688 RepID=UPI000835C781|nr:MIR domain-containing protein [Bacillus sp. FJAT-29814]